ncbi:SDR family oxidoreductase [Devosia sp. MC521]|uniref:SDR family oxidoreductase n=1 Tax=Devosia sp. MC521 TaxID=2759954 RepID=UPI0015FA4ECB|nr:SDR family oxidoreductase [Devosia sp. MC521]MBJ6988401.1 SDR family oxidoreductase [Devosia sp. MC521]QMW62990.1 SDR family oxidoreductase [Devosia sp. MC521]
MADISGKIVLITAAAQGIGEASARAFAAAGAKVIATDINAAKLAELNGTPNITTRVLNVLSDADVAAAVAEIGHIDVLFNCAGVVHSGSVLEMSDADLDFALDLNVRAQIRTIRAILPQMLERKDGAIINMATVASSIKGVPNRAAYSISKAAVIGLTKSIAGDYTTSNIRVNAICPGTVESPSLHDRWHATGDFEGAKKAFIARQPIGRIAQPQEVADLAVYLAGATYTTGQVHIIDGGWTG